MENLKDFLQNAFSNKNIRRWAVEICVATAIGIIVGCITYNALGSEKKQLTVSDEAAAAPVVEEEQNETDVTGDGLPEDDPDANVVISVVEDTEETTTTGTEDYAPEIADWSMEEISAAIEERSGYAQKSKYYSALVSYWENVREVRDVDWQCRYLFDTDSKVYTEADFSGLSAEVIHIAKNEIYARHGYSFKDYDLYNYFMADIWYSPSVLPADFSEDVFSETEVKNLDLLNSLDTM